MMERIRTLPVFWRWLAAAVITAAVISVLTAAAMPASMLQGAMLAAILLSVGGADLHLPRSYFLFGQSLIGCVIAASVKPETLGEFAGRWPQYLSMVLAVLVISAIMGWFVAKQGILPGTTAVWGISPGAASMMILMSEQYGADPRLVAVMQYLRVVMVSLTAGVVARIWGTAATAAAINETAAATGWRAGVVWPLLLAAAGCLVAVRGRTSAAMLVPLLGGLAAKATGLFDPQIPWPLMLAANVLIGWGVGFRFDRPVVRHAIRVMPRLFMIFALMIALCGAAGMALGRLAGVDPLTSFLATSPGGMDSMAILALSIGGDTSLVMAVQMLRFILTTLTGPATATFTARLIGGPIHKEEK